MSKQEEITRLSIEKGYTVDENGKAYNKDGKELSLSKGPKGYLSFNIRINGSKPTRLFIHRLQAYQKFGDVIFDEEVVVRHKNGLSTDNSFKNIEIGSQSENMMDIPKVKRSINSSNPKHNHIDIINDYNNGLTYGELCVKYNISSKGTISFIIKKSLKSATTYGEVV